MGAISDSHLLSCRSLASLLFILSSVPLEETGPRPLALVHNPLSAPLLVLESRLDVSRMSPPSPLIALAELEDAEDAGCRFLAQSVIEM